MRATTFLWVVLAFGWIVGSARAAETTIRVGDTIAISAFGLPELDKKAVVDKSGEISYPIIGSIKVAGTSPSDLRRRIIDGLVKGGLAREPKIGVEITLREPFYVTGDVMKPGAQPFALNITVRSAVALAGGIDPGGARSARAAANPVELRGQYDTLVLELLKQRAHMRKLEAGLADKKTIDFDDFSDLPVAKNVVDKVNEFELAELKMRAEETQNEKSYLQRVIIDTKAQIAALAERRRAEEESVNQQKDQIAKVKGLTERGMVVQGRLLDEQRAMMMAQGKLFETIAFQASTDRLLEELMHKLQTIDETRRLAFIKELQDAYVAAAAAEARLGALRLQLNVKGGPTQAFFVIYREDNGARARVNANEDSEIEPGDIVEVRFGTPTAVAAQ